MVGPEPVHSVCHYHCTLSMFSCRRWVLTTLIGGQERHPEVRGNLRPDVCQRWRGDHYQRLRGEAGPQAGNEGKNIWLSVENICVRMENICGAIGRDAQTLQEPIHDCI